jgi:hypothetical protein
MAITIETSESAAMTLADYIDYVSREVDLQDAESVLASAPALRSLAQNRTFLVDYLNRELAQSWDTFQPDNSYSAQTLTLGAGKDFSIRANMWLPSDPASDGWDDRLYAYGLAHDHNFSFLTVGYLGPGYRTSIYEYDSMIVEGFPGERVELKFLERTSLPVGKIMLYRASRDIHTQEPPEDFSMSLNLLIVSPSVRNSNQYTFNIEKGEIHGYVPNASGGRVMLVEMAKYVGDGRTVSLIESICRRHPVPRLRWAAYNSLATLEKGSSEQIFTRAAADLHPYVRRMASEKLKEGTS